MKANQKFKQIPFYIIDDKQADRIGAAIAEDFGLKRCRDYPDQWDTQGGTFTNRGIARRAHRIIQEHI